MYITNVGSALNFAKELEAAEMVRCREGVDFFADPDIKNLCLRLAAECEKRISLLEKIYEDYTFSDMDAGILAPIEAINGAHYGGPENWYADKDMKAVSEKWHKSLQATDRFYADFSDRLLSGPKSLHRRIGRIINKRTEIKSLIDSVINK